ncbi:MAG: glycoside hydrolase family 65 protein [Clostridiaceae bacterium]|nr:glycoside hydrolase family 65 protein [Clostridiaceae bacterium]
MNQYLIVNEWEIIEDAFISTNNRVSESIFSLGNGYMGQRANFEEHYSGDSLKGNYMAGVYYPDKTRVGWWKNGYPEYFAKVLNSINWIGIDIVIDGEQLDLAVCKTEIFKRTLNMKEGFLERRFEATLPSGKRVKVYSKRFLSIVTKEIGAIQYSITPVNFSGELKITPYLDGDVINEDSNYDEKFWEEISKINSSTETSLKIKTKKLDFHVCSTMLFDIFQNDKKLNLPSIETSRDKYVAKTIKVCCTPDLETVIYKYVANVTSRNLSLDTLSHQAFDLVEKAQIKGFNYLLKEQAKAWEEKWLESDIVINGDLSAQQAIRYNIFQLNQTYTGEDDRLNIGPKGFTGEKYGGSTYWDTEAYCLPFYLATAEEKIARNLLIYRFKQLEQAKANAKKLGFTKGALYPMVTMNGEECHNEWEITFEEIHRNGAIAHAIYDYVNYTGDKSYLGEFGLTVLVEISRFWEERVNFSCEKNKYVMLGVTGPNEYENNVNNNWYTSKIACWTLEYTLEVIDYLKINDPAVFEQLDKELGLKVQEINKWKDIITNMYFAFDEKLGIFLQQDGYMDKDQTLVRDLDPSNLPINQNWSWDRILRSCYIKQADVLQGLYLLENNYSLDTIKKNFDFYEPRTVHESSLSPCVHSILAAKIGYKQKAYEMYLRTARLDLDNYNNDTSDGCHITSMAGTWMSVIQGFAGMRVTNGNLCFTPFIPEHWGSYSFKIMFRNHLLELTIDKNKIIISKKLGDELSIIINSISYSFKDILTIEL